MIKPRKISIYSRAKINLFLKISRKRSDGFHNIFSVIQAVDLVDEITFSLEKGLTGITIRTPHPDLPTDEENLIVKAYNELAAIKEPDNSEGIVCDINKKIPIHSGLGGGSSNCAATLTALNQLLDINLEPSGLAEIGAKLGSDVPFFFTGGTCFVHGRGELIDMLPSITDGGFLIITPPVGVNTAEAYNDLDNYREKKGFEINKHFDKDSLRELFHNSLLEKNFVSYIQNDFEEVIFEKYPLIGELKARLLRLNPATALSGSGSAVFSYFNSYNEAWEALENYTIQEGEIINIARPVQEGNLIYG